ncbi:response regulator transcription factor [Vibrio algarum]|uniref:LuxR C-terminal-related transcriptional regulator n=1 Tax=Vibrio algarum TaxID=3020714 RepID=A0ABT4YUB2_9VIBR|nr:LuxR C-terminal-related transcriptional regulator [Vibrio sp. KJ40-1]MDB1125165.1 LuxR C-terminal-related transcriptional regulator [Vibrio sp. KJ40-1]
MMTTTPQLVPNDRHIDASSLDDINTDYLVHFLTSIISFDTVVILGYHDNQKPVYLYDSINTRKDLLFQRYLTSSFTYDPFYCQIMKEGVEGIFNINDILIDDWECQNYRKQFYYNIKREDELALMARIDDTRSIAIFLGRQEANDGFTEEQKQLVFRRYNDIKEQCLQFNPENNWLPLDEKESSHALSVHQALATFATDVLTTREQEVIMLMVQGLSNNDIAVQLQISVATVKVHRKSIYSKLKVTNLNEFWQLFLAHLISCV